MTKKDPPPDVPGPDSLTKRLNTWKSRATFDSYTDRAVRGAQVTDGFANAIRQAYKAAKDFKLPQVGDIASIPCPHCDGPMTIINVIHDSIVIQCPACESKKGPSK